MMREGRRIGIKRGRRAAAALLMLSLIAAGCGAGGEHAGHDMQAEPTAAGNAAADNHSGHGGNEAGAENEHAGHGAGASNGEEEHTESAHEDGMGAETVKLEWRYTPANPEPGKQTKIELFISDKSGKPIEEFEVSHEKLLHLILVSGDLSDFMHIHPEFKGNGKFEVEAAFGKSGTYKLFADFIPQGASQMTAESQVKVNGAAEASDPLRKDESLTKVENGIEVSLKLSTLKAGENANLTFSFKDASTKAEVTDLEPYLGAIGHVVIINEDVNRYLHVHPLEGNGTGPTAEFATTFPEAGLYKVWGQFQRDGKTFIVPFTVEIE